jgi:hypothetical protein
MATRKSARQLGAARRRKLSPAEVRKQQGAELPEREAMSLILPSTGGLPMVGDAATTGAGTPYVGGVQGPALDQTENAQQLATSSSSTGENVPNGTATASSTT